ncbi:tyrosine-type recombinase/integrase, partial [Patescibacteria group bacterium]|nr:tyrosine-type recombinase/integrase [Patescibacteria group bacterium]
MPNQLNNYISDYLEYLNKDTATAAQTIKNYQFYLGRFMEATGATEPNDITEEKVKTFLEFLKQIRNGRGELMKLSTQNYHLIALRAFLDYLKNVGVTSLPAESVILNKTKRQPIVYLEGSDLEKLLEAPLHTKNFSIIQTRDKAILELLFSTGLKVSEIASMRRAQIKFNLSEIAIPNDTNSSRTIPLTNLVKYWLKQYLEARIDSAPALF